MRARQRKTADAIEGNAFRNSNLSCLYDRTWYGNSLSYSKLLSSLCCWIAALEAAAGEAKRGELNVYEAFALYDLKDVRANATLPEDDKLKKRLNDLVKAMVAPSQVLLDAIAT